MNEYIFGDAMQLMVDLPENSADLVFTSMPDLSQTPYGKSEKGIQEYRAFQAAAIYELTKIVKPEGLSSRMPVALMFMQPRVKWFSLAMWDLHVVAHLVPCVVISRLECDD